MLHRHHPGTYVFIFQARAETVAADWVYEIWRDLGGEIPSHLEVNVPNLGVRIHLPIPEDAEDTVSEWMSSGTDDMKPERHGEGFKLLTPHRIVRACRRLLVDFPDWQGILSQHDDAGVKLGLAWHRNEVLDWIWTESAVDGSTRDYAVFAGLALKMVNKY